MSAWRLQLSLYFTTLYFKTTLDYKTTQFGPKVPLYVLNDLYFKTTCNIRPHFLGSMGGLNIEGLLYTTVQHMDWQAHETHETLKSSIFMSNEEWNTK